jgi:hypothetical protein
MDPPGSIERSRSITARNPIALSWTAFEDPGD